MDCAPVVPFLCALPQSAFAQHAAANRSLSPEPAPRPVTTAGTSARRIAWYGLGTLLLGLLAVSPLHAQTATVGNTVPLGGGFQLPYGVAVDASGNVYVADEQGSAVKEMPPGCATSTCVTTLGAGFLFPTSVAVDSSGNVYVADYGNSAVKEMTPGCATSSCVKPLGGGFVNPQGVAVDSSGNVYVADYGNNAVKEMTPNCTSSSCVTPLGAGFVSPAEVAVDASDNVYVTDGQNNGAVKEMTPDCTSSSCVTMLGGGFNSPFGVAVDGSGNIYVGDTGNYVMKEMPSGCAASTCVITLFADVVGVAVSASGILYVSNAGNNTVDEFFPQSLRLHAVAVRSTGPAVPVSFYFTAGGSGISATVVTQGASGLDFADAGTGTCDTNGTGHTYSIGDTCSVKVTLTPKYAGPRYGAVQLLNGSRSVIATALIYGTGLGPQIQFPSNPTIAPLGGGFSYPFGVAVDGAGNIYVADTSAVKEMPAGCATSSCVTTLGGGFSYPYGVAVDGAGNIYVADTFDSKVKEMPPACATSSCVTTLGGGFAGPQAVAVDGSGNVYVADTNNNAVKEMPPGCAISSCVTTLGGGFSQPSGVAVDGSGNVYVGDYDNSLVKEMPPGCATSSCVTTLGGGFSQPSGVAVDGSGNVYVGDYGNSLVKEMPAGCPSASCVTTLGSGFSGPSGVALDSSGNVYVGDFLHNAVKELPLAIPPSLSFANANMGTQSSDSPKTVTLRNIGNQSLVFPVPGTGENPSVSASFTLDPATTCPEVLSSGSAGTLASGASCGLAVDFIPRSTGSISGSATYTDNSLNVANAMQSIGLSGTGLAALITPAVTVSPASSKITTSEALSVTVTVSGGNGNPTPTGSVVLSGGGYTSSAKTLSAGSANINIPAGQLAVGSDTLTATYTPDSGSSMTYNSATGSAPVTVVNSTLPCANPNPNPNPNPASFANPGDFNGDCKSDILWRNGSSEEVYEWLMNGTSVLSQGSPGGPSSAWVIEGAGDFNGDGKSDILWQNSGSGEVYVWVMNGTTIASQGTPGTVTPSSGWVIAGVGDFDGDGKADVLWRNSTTGDVYLWLMNGTTIASQGDVGVVSPSSGWNIVGVGDFNGDGKADILWQNSTSGEVYLWLMSGTTIASQGSPGTVSPSSGWVIQGTGDFDGNGMSDILWRNSTSGEVYIWLMSGTTVTSQGTPGTVSSAWSIKGTGDYNGDGKADVLWQNSSGEVYVWEMNGLTITGQGSPGTASSPWQIATLAP